MTMASLNLVDRTSQTKAHHLADEILLQIFKKFQLPSASVIGRERYEVLNVPKGPLVGNQALRTYTDNELFTGACTHKHEEWKALLHTLSSISKANKRFRRVVSPLLYHVYPGQTLVNPHPFLRTLKHRRDLAVHVKQLVIDPWDITSKKSTRGAVEQLGLSYKLVESLHKTAKRWNDESHAALLLFYCSNAEVLSLVTPSASGEDAAIFTIAKRLQHLGPNTLARSNEEASKWREQVPDLPLRRLRELHLHHAENMYIRSLAGSRQLMLLPTASSITAYRFWNGPEALGYLRPVQNLTLHRCSFDSAKLLDAIETCTGLRSLEIIFAGCKATLGQFTDNNDVPNFPRLGVIIRTKLTKLRKLRLDDREISDQLPHRLGSLKDGPALEELALNEACLGCYGIDEGDKVIESSVRQSAADYALGLEELLPSSLRSLSILRTNLWWHDALRMSHGQYHYAGYTKDNGLSYQFDRIHDKVRDLLREKQESLPQLEEIHLDVPVPFDRNVRQAGWECHRVVGDKKVARASIVGDSLMTPEFKKEWEHTMKIEASQPSILLKKMRS